MRNKQLYKLILAGMAVVALAGCSGGEQKESAQNSDTVVASQTESQSDVQSNEQDATQSAETIIPATVTVKVDYEDGSPNLVETLDISGVAGTPDESGSIIYGYDDAGKLIYKREDSGVTEENGTLHVTICYEFYSLDYDFNLSFEPLEPENTPSIQTINGSIVKRNEGGETSEEFTYDNVGMRGGTGIWYAGICSCKNGVLGAYDVP